MKNLEHEIKSVEEIVTLTDDEKLNLHSNKCFTCKQPPDSGYSWVILLTGFILVVLLASTGSLFSLIFIHKIKALNMSTFSVAFCFNFRSFLWNVASTMSGPLCDQFGWRKVAITGAFLCSLSIMLCCYANSVISMNIYFSILNGLGGGLAFSTCLFVLANYFIRLRGFALAIMGSGFAVGQLILPFFITYLQEHYGFHGAALIFSAFLLNGIVAAAFFHPLKWHQHGRKYSAKNSIDDDDNNDMIINSSPLRCCFTITWQNSKQICKKILKLTYFNVVNLKSPVVFIISVSGGCKIVAFLNIVLMLPLSFISKGLALQEAAYCLSVIGTSILVFRLITPILSDFKSFNTTFFYITGHLLVAVSCLDAFTFVSKFSYIVLCFGFFGVGVGASMGLQPIILIDYRGLKQLPQTYGSFGFVNALLFILIGTTIGYTRDTSGSYILMYQLLSGILLISALIWILMPYALSYERRQLQKTKDIVVN